MISPKHTHFVCSFENLQFSKHLYTCNIHVNYMSKRVKIDVYLSSSHKNEILKRAKKLDLSVSDYMKLKALDMIKNE